MSNKKLDTTAIVAISCGGLFGLSMVAGGVFLLMRIRIAPSRITGAIIDIKTLKLNMPLFSSTRNVFCNFYFISSSIFIFQNVEEMTILMG